MAMGQQILAQSNDSLETLMSLDASQAEWRSPFEGQQVACVTEQARDDGIGNGGV
jgi:hypothetical protein